MVIVSHSLTALTFICADYAFLGGRVYSKIDVLIMFLGSTIFPILYNRYLANTSVKKLENILLFVGLSYNIYYSYLGALAPDYYALSLAGYLLGPIGYLGWLPRRPLVLMVLITSPAILFIISLKIFYPAYLSSNTNIVMMNQIPLFMLSMLLVYTDKTIKKNRETQSKLLVKTRNNNRIITEERQKSEKLLLNILPSEVADELKKEGATSPRHYDSVSVMFTDFVGFTDIANQIEPNELVRELDNCFSYFDSVTKKYNLEKIKTIGDSYMTCAGVPNTNNTHQVDTVLAALEIQSFMLQTKEIKDTQGLPYWELRLGINTGPLVAGVIGEMKFAYDVFGDTVNTASRMESSGEKGMINISQSVYDSVRHFFECEHRGKVQAKRKGELDMYFVHGVKKEHSRNGEGRVPNKRFFRDYLRLKKYGTV